MSAYLLSELGEPHPGWCHIRHGAGEAHRSNPRDVDTAQGPMAVWVSLHDDELAPTVHLLPPGAPKPIDMSASAAQHLGLTVGYLTDVNAYDPLPVRRAHANS